MSARFLTPAEVRGLFGPADPRAETLVAHAPECAWERGEYDEVPGFFLGSVTLQRAHCTCGAICYVVLPAQKEEP